RPRGVVLGAEAGRAVGHGEIGRLCFGPVDFRLAVICFITHGNLGGQGNPGRLVRRYDTVTTLCTSVGDLLSLAGEGPKRAFWGPGRPARGRRRWGGWGTSLELLGARPGAS